MPNCGENTSINFILSPFHGRSSVFRMAFQQQVINLHLQISLLKDTDLHIPLSAHFMTVQCYYQKVKGAKGQP